MKAKLNDSEALLTNGKRLVNKATDAMTKKLKSVVLELVKKLFNSHLETFGHGLSLSLEHRTSVTDTAAIRAWFNNHTNLQSWALCYITSNDKCKSPWSFVMEVYLPFVLSVFYPVEKGLSNDVVERIARTGLEALMKETGCLCELEQIGNREIHSLKQKVTQLANSHKRNHQVKVGAMLRAIYGNEAAEIWGGNVQLKYVVPKKNASIGPLKVSYKGVNGQMEECSLYIEFPESKLDSEGVWGGLRGSQWDKELSIRALPAPAVPNLLPHGDAMQMQRHLQEPRAECANLNVAGNHQNAAVGLPPTGVHNDAMQRRFQGPSAKNLNVAQRTFLQPAGVQNDAKFGNGASIPLQSWDCEGIESDSMFSGDGEEMTELLGSKHGDEEETMKLLGNPMPLTVSDDVMAQSTSERRSKAETNQSRNEATKQKKQQQQQKKRKKAALENVQHNSKKQQQQQNRKGVCIYVIICVVLSVKTKTNHILC